MRWEYLWLKLALETERSINVRVIETSKRLAWSAYGTSHVVDQMPSGGTTEYHPQRGGVSSSAAPHHEVFSPDVWAKGLDALGGDGWELVSVVSLSADRRITELPASVASAGKHDVQLWIFKRERLGDAVANPEPEEES